MSLRVGGVKKIFLPITQPRPQGFSLKKNGWKSPGDEVADHLVGCEDLILVKIDKPRKSNFFEKFDWLFQKRNQQKSEIMFTIILSCLLQITLALHDIRTVTKLRIISCVRK